MTDKDHPEEVHLSHNVVSSLFPVIVGDNAVMGRRPLISRLSFERYMAHSYYDANIVDTYQVLTSLGLENFILRHFSNVYITAPVHDNHFIMSITHAAEKPVIAFRNNETALLFKMMHV